MTKRIIATGSAKHQCPIQWRVGMVRNCSTPKCDNQIVIRNKMVASLFNDGYTAMCAYCMRQEGL